ncbi:MAG: hypothetical protein ACRDL7_06625, partial [Gaiellaceae bacterium]
DRSEPGRRLRMDLSHDGLPDSLTVKWTGGASVRIEYLEWMSAAGAKWPREFRVSNDRAGAMLRCRVSRLRVRAAADSSMFRSPGPDDASPESGCEWWHMLSEGPGR